MTAFAYELASLIAAQAQAHPGDVYSMPWYLVLGEPHSGRSTAIRALNLSWPRGDQPVSMNVPGQSCVYWLPETGVFIEPGPTVLGPTRQPDALMELCQELRVKRAREPLDGIVVVVNAQTLADSGEDAVERYATALRRYVVEVGQALNADVPVYLMVTAYDVLWGFGDAFQWTAERVREDPWGFSLPPATPQAQATSRVLEELEALTARVESTCFAKLASEDTPDARARAYQHLADSRDVLKKLGEVLKILTTSNAFERSPWVRALVLGSGIPGTGHRLRHRAEQFSAMGYHPPQHSGTPQPGGIPVHPLLDQVLIPDRHLVPTATRWRDDKLTIALWIFGVLGWVAIIALAIVRTLAT